MQPARDIPALTGLRGVAAYTVLIAHAIDYGLVGQHHAWMAGLAYFGMSLFFVLSGFVIALNYSDVRGASGAWRFFVARFARLYPLYILLLVASRVLYPPEAPYSDFFGDPLAALAALTLTQGWFNVQGISGTAFGQSWSISTEWGFYAAFPFLVLIPVRRPVVALFAFLVVAFAALGVLYLNRDAAIAAISPFVPSSRPYSAPPWWWLTYFAPWLRVLEFIAGMLACRAYLSRPYLPAWLLPASLAGIAAVYAASPWATEGWPLDMLRSFAFAPFIVPALLAICLAGSRVLESRPLLLMGEISYSVYCLQFGAFIVVSRYVDRGWGFAIVSILVITVAAVPTYWLYERPARRLLRRLYWWPISSASRKSSSRSADVLPMAAPIWATSGCPRSNVEACSHSSSARPPAAAMAAFTSPSQPN